MAEKKKKETTKISAALFSNDEDEDQKLQPLVPHIDWTSSLINIFVCARKESKAAAYKQ